MLWAAAVASLALLLASAKAHGRQLRLERELEGHHEVVFGGRNHPWVERRWRQDRIGYWSLVPVLALVLAAMAWPHGWGARLVAALLWAPIGGFVALGLVSHARLVRALRTRTADPTWLRAAWRGSAFWWTLVAALALAVIVLWTL